MNYHLTAWCEAFDTGRILGHYATKDEAVRALKAEADKYPHLTAISDVDGFLVIRLYERPSLPQILLLEINKQL